MEIKYITTDLELRSEEDLSSIVEEFGDEVLVHLNQRVGDFYEAALGGIYDFSRPEDAVAAFCDLIQDLSPNSKKAWENCSARTLDLAFESGKKPNSMIYPLPAGLIRRVCRSGLGIAITIYSTGSYSQGKSCLQI